MGDVEFGTCDICGIDDYISRKYYSYDVICECHSPNHFELVYHCKNCLPVEPTETKILLRQESNNEKYGFIHEQIVLETDSLKKKEN